MTFDIETDARERADEQNRSLFGPAPRAPAAHKPALDYHRLRGPIDGVLPGMGRVAETVATGFVDPIWGDAIRDRAERMRAHESEGDRQGTAFNACVEEHEDIARVMCRKNILPDGGERPAKVDAAECMSMWADGYAGGSSSNTNSFTHTGGKTAPDGPTTSITVGVPGVGLNGTQPASSTTWSDAMGGAYGHVRNEATFDGYRKTCLAEATKGSGAK